MNKRIGIVLIAIGALVAIGFVLLIVGYQVTPDPTPPDFTGQDNGSP
jgi:hypothetical protein